MNAAKFIENSSPFVMVAAEGRGGRGMGGEDNGQNLEALAQRIEALDQRLAVLDRENRELREAVRSGAAGRQLEMSQQQPPQAKEMAVASSKTVGDLLLGPRDEQAYSRPWARVLPSYVVGLLLTCVVAAYGPYQDLVLSGAKGLGWMLLGAIAAFFFGVYAGDRDGRRFAFARFHYVGLITAMGTAIVMFLTSLWVTNFLWRPPPYPSPLGWIIENRLFPLAVVSASTWLLFVSGALLGTALQLWTSEKEQRGREGYIQDSSEGRAASTSGVRAQVWLGFAGTVLAALIGLIGTLIASR